ncbi:hypothetical protein KNE206_30100 [Kitasatospora sp. NE20-6]|uniref:hypothetical protein n=1 Tax=Kitasatospora sp. NE20-6 TaxID=2859066 RepID=UPI0034DB8BA4
MTTTSPATKHEAALFPAWLATVDAQRDMARLVARTIADTLSAQLPGAAYLTLMIQEDTERDEHLFPESVRDTAGDVLFDFEGHMPPLGPEHAELRAQWGNLAPDDPFALRTMLRYLYINGAVFDRLPEDLDDSGDDDEVPCLLLSAEARPHEWEHEGEDTWDVEARRLRPYSAAKPKTAAPKGTRL